MGSRCQGGPGVLCGEWVSLKAGSPTLDTCQQSSWVLSGLSFSLCTAEGLGWLPPGALGVSSGPLVVTHQTLNGTGDSVPPLVLPRAHRDGECGAVTCEGRADLQAQEVVHCPLL